MAVNIRIAENYRDLVSGLRSLDLGTDRPVIVHCSLSAFGEIRGGADTLLGALLRTIQTLIVPAFTSRPEIIPEVGPEDNAIDYGSGESSNLLAEFFHPEMPVDKIIGIIPEILRRRAGARRSSHPLLSFAGYQTDRILEAQTIKDPLAPIGIMAERDGWVLLLGVDHTVNTSIHYAEKLAGRTQFLRWALTPGGVCECPGYPGCSNGFNAISPYIEKFTRQIMLGEARVQAIPLRNLITEVTALLAEDPAGLLCDRMDCQRCNTIRKIIAARRMSQ